MKTRQQALTGSRVRVQLRPVEADSDLRVAKVEQGTVHQETMRFHLPAAVQGLRCVKQYTVRYSHLSHTSNPPTQGCRSSRAPAPHSQR